MEACDSNEGYSSESDCTDGQVCDLNNFKGIYFDNDSEKYTCPDTGAHFNFKVLCRKLETLRIERKDPKCKQLRDLMPAVQEIFESNQGSGDKREGEVTESRVLEDRNSENFGEDSLDEQLTPQNPSRLNFLSELRKPSALQKSKSIQNLHFIS